MSWQQAWQEKRTPWDAGASPPVLRELVDSGSLPSGRALVPGCGSGYDVLTLATHAAEVVGLDVSELARERFDSLRAKSDIEAERASVRVDDFFSFDPGEPFDLIWDYTFLCALDPDRRAAWAQRMEQLLHPGGELVTLIFPVDPVPLNPGGPPHPMTPELVRELLEPRFEATALEPVQRSLSGRAGKEWLGRWKLVAR